MKAAIARESKQQAADAKAYEVEAEARAKAYKTKVDAETQAAADYNKTTKNTDAAAYKTKMDAEAWSDAAIKNAEANLQKKLKEAEGMVAMANAYAKMSEAFGGPSGLIQYSKWLLMSDYLLRKKLLICIIVMIEKGTYVELAKANAAAVNGMQPKISVWNTGSEAGSSGAVGQGQDSASTLRNVSSYPSTPI